MLFISFRSIFLMAVRRYGPLSLAAIFICDFKFFISFASNFMAY